MAKIRITDPDFPRRLEELRRAAGLRSWQEVAEMAGLAYNTVHLLATGERKVAFEDTLVRIAEVLETDLKTLVGADTAWAGNQHSRRNPTGPSGSSRWRSRVILFLTIVTVLLVGWRLRPGIGNVALDIDGDRVCVRSGVLQSKECFPRHESKVKSATVTPWEDPRSVAYGLGGNASDAGLLMVREVGSGRELWSDRTSLRAVETIYGPDIAYSGAYWVNDIRFADLDGDEAPELIAYFMHDHWYPAHVRVYDRYGIIQGTYYNWGHLYAFHAEDVDQDGKDELLVGGTNNRYNGATVLLLDDIHCHGASVDSMVRPHRAVADSCVVRVVFPQFEPEYMKLLEINRLETVMLRTFKGPDDRLIVSADVGSGGETFFVVNLDQFLRPLSVGTSDLLDRMTLRWPPERRQELKSTEYLDAWLRRSIRSGVLASGAE